MSRSLIRKNQLHPDIADLVGEYGSGYFISDQKVVFLTGDQTVSGTKFFADYIELINPNYGIVFNNNASTYATNIVGNRTGITLSTFQSPTDINIKSDFVGGFIEDVISVRNPDNTGLFGASINGLDSIVIYQSGEIYGVPSSIGPYIRLGESNIISEKTGSRLGIGTLFPQEKVHISGGRLRVDGNIIANNVVYNTGNQTISGLKSFVNSSDYLVAKFEGPNGNPLEIFSTDESLSIGYGDTAYAIGVGDQGFAVKYGSSNNDWGKPLLLSEGGTTVVHPASTITFPNGIDLQNSPIINSVPQIISRTSNFSVSGDSNGRMITVNSSTLITGIITSGNPTGFNTSIIQVGAGQIQITGSGVGIQINSYNNQYRTAGQFATVSLIHTGNNGYIMYGNTSS